MTDFVHTDTRPRRTGEFAGGRLFAALLGFVIPAIILGTMTGTLAGLFA